MTPRKPHPVEKELLAGLNEEQRSAVAHGEGPLLVVAGAGTGKTMVLIRRIAWLIAAKKAEPGEILALTFTDKAAEEMELRVDQLVPYGYIDVSISTFHAFGDRVLRDHAIDLGLSPDYRVLSRPEQLVFLREHLFGLPLEYYRSLSDPTKHLEALLGVISRAQDEDVSSGEFLSYASKRGQGAKGPRVKGASSQYPVAREDKELRAKHLEIAKVYKKYQELKAGKGFIDFGDQVGLVLKLFRERPAVLKKFQQKYKYILVDEFQDTNYAQFELLKLLAGKKANITVVGDDDQSIYKFRGAAVSNILDFRKHYKKCKQVVLTRNYRSSQIILDTAHKLIRFNDPERLEVRAGIDKRLVSCVEPARKTRGSIRPQHMHFDRIGSEADWVASEIRKRYDEGDKYGDFALLTRSNADAEPFRQSLNLLGIPHQFSGGGGLYANPEVQLAVAFLKSIGDLADSPALFQLAASSLYQMDPLDLQKLSTFAKRRNFTLHHVFAHLEDGGETFEILGDLKKETREKVRQVMADLNYYLDFAKERTTGEVLHRFLTKSGFLARLTREETPENDRRLRNLANFFERIREFREIAEFDRVAEFIKHLSVLREAGDNPETTDFDPDLDAVSVLTVHKAKGLEFRVVFLVSLVAEKFPARRRSDPIELPAGLIKEPVPAGDQHLQEERRLFYVGMTRAKKELFLTSALDYGGKRQRKVSPFVLEALDQPKADIRPLKRPARDQIELFAPSEIVLPAMPRVKPDEILALSFSQIDDYLRCSLKYKYVHVLRVPLLPNHQIIYGSAMHRAAQAYSQARMNGKKMSAKALIKVLEKHWSSEGFISRAHEEQRLARAKEALTLFCRDQAKSKRKIRFVEESFSIPRGKLLIRGRWDRVDELNGKVHIVDFKTSEVKDQEQAEDKAKNSDQLAIYAWVWQEKFGELPARVELYFIENGLIGSVKKTEADIVKVWAKISGVEEGIRSNSYPAQPSYRECSYCAYNEICPRAML